MKWDVFDGPADEGASPVTVGGSCHAEPLTSCKNIEYYEPDMDDLNLFQPTEGMKEPVEFLPERISTFEFDNPEKLVAGLEANTAIQFCSGFPRLTSGGPVPQVSGTVVALNGFRLAKPVRAPGERFCMSDPGGITPREFGAHRVSNPDWGIDVITVAVGFANQPKAGLERGNSIRGLNGVPAAPSSANERLVDVYFAVRQYNTGGTRRCCQELPPARQFATKWATCGVSKKTGMAFRIEDS